MPCSNVPFPLPLPPGYALARWNATARRLPLFPLQVDALCRRPKFNLPCPVPCLVPPDSRVAAHASPPHSGHGGQARATQGDERDGLNETILPLDYKRAGQIEDDEINRLLVNRALRGSEEGGVACNENLCSVCAGWLTFMLTCLPRPQRCLTGCA